jgi:hypothetical protein
MKKSALFILLCAATFPASAFAETAKAPGAPSEAPKEAAPASAQAPQPVRVIGTKWQLKQPRKKLANSAVQGPAVPPPTAQPRLPAARSGPRPKRVVQEPRVKKVNAAPMIANIVRRKSRDD